MCLHRVLVSRLERSFALHRDFADTLGESSLAEKLPGLPSNAIGLQLWCVVGARESYTEAIRAGRWAGFACSLESPLVKMDVTVALERSEAGVKAALLEVEPLSEVQQDLALDLLEHEAAHQGQLIRYLYGLRLPIPDSWRARYALAPSK